MNVREQIERDGECSLESAGEQGERKTVNRSRDLLGV